MRRSLILKTSASPILGIALGLSIYILIRGHNAPGGGFLGGLIASGGILYFLMARGVHEAKRLFFVSPVALCAVGFLIAMASGLLGLFDPGLSYLTHHWWMPDIGIVLPLGTTMAFDLGVYVTVIGTMSTLFIYLEQD